MPRIAPDIIHPDGSFQVGSFTLEPKPIRAILRAAKDPDHVFALRIRGPGGSYRWRSVSRALLLRYVSAESDNLDDSYPFEIADYSHESGATRYAFIIG